MFLIVFFDTIYASGSTMKSDKLGAIEFYNDVEIDDCKNEEQIKNLESRNLYASPNIN